MFLKAQDTISGQEATAFATIDGQVEEMFYISTLSAQADKTKAELKTLGRRGVQRKATGWSGTGSMTIYYVTSKFREMMEKYIQTGVDTYFDIEVKNEDPTSSIGPQRVTLRDVNLDSAVMAMIDVNSEAMTEDVNFTFDDVTLSQSFSPPRLGQ